MQGNVDFLGYIIENGTIIPASGKIDVLVDYPSQSTQKLLHRLLGVTGYSRKFIQNYALICPFLERSVWQTLQENPFSRLKQALVEVPVLQLYRPNRETELHFNASRDGYAAILMQKIRHSIQYII